MDDISNIINILCLITKEEFKKESINILEENKKLLRQDEVNSRRIKVKGNIKLLAELDIAILEFETQYKIFKSKNDNIDALEQYIKEIKLYRKKIVFEKKNIARTR